MLGLDPETRSRLYQWSDAMMGGDGHLDPDAPQVQAAATAFGEYTDVCLELIAQRRLEPKDDIIGSLTGAFDEGAAGRARRGAPLRRASWTSPSC